MGGRYTFTAGQWEELEVQAMIYKYMVASLPVPYQLLLPIIQSQSQSLLPFPLRYSSSSKEQDEEEVGRCKRTDGKKWRCSRDVAAPNHKYCERHMHRGRPRSRKHVELSNNQSLSTSTNGGSTTTTILPSSSSSATKHPFFLHNNIIMQSNKRGCDWSSEVGSASASIFNNNDYFYERGDFNLSMGNTREVSNPLAEVLVGGGVSSSSPYPTPTPTGGDDGVVSASASQKRRRRRMLLSDDNNNTPTLVTTLPFQ